MGCEVVAPQEICKTPAEELYMSMDFAKLLAAGATLSSGAAVTASPSGLTLGAASISGTKVVALVEEGTDGKTYLLAWRVVDSGGNLHEAKGRLVVKER